MSRSPDYPAFAMVTIEVWPPGAGGGETLRRRPYPSRSWSTHAAPSLLEGRSAQYASGLGAHPALVSENAELEGGSTAMSVRKRTDRCSMEAWARDARGRSHKRALDSPVTGG